MTKFTDLRGASLTPIHLGSVLFSKQEDLLRVIRKPRVGTLPRNPDNTRKRPAGLSVQLRKRVLLLISTNPTLQRRCPGTYLLPEDFVAMTRQRTRSSRVEIEARLLERGQTQTFGAGLYLYKPYSPKEMRSRRAY